MNHWTAISFWHWFIIAGVFLILELTTGSGFMLWVGMAAVLVGGVVFLVPTLIWPLQLLCWAIGSFVAIYLWWRYVRVLSEKNDQPVLNKRAHQYIGRTLTLETAIDNGRGRVKIGDTLWRVTGPDLPVGTKVEVIDVDGVLLSIKPHKE